MLLECIDPGSPPTAVTMLLDWWTLDFSPYVERHPIGTKAHLALNCSCWSASASHIRRPDRVSAVLRNIHPVRWLAFRQHKNRNSKSVDLVIPILPQLEIVLGWPRPARPDAPKASARPVRPLQRRTAPSRIS
jgi:hypothetical protein